MADAAVAIAAADGGYPDTPGAAPYDPGEAYPEFGGRPVAPRPNAAFAAVRRALAELGLDRERFGTPGWNPLGGIVKPGDRVFVKPNLVTHEYRRSCRCDGDLFAVITHPSVVRAIADYAALALAGRGELVIGDNPSIDADWTQLLARTRLDALAPIYPVRFGVPCRVLDLRPLVCDDLASYGFRYKMREQPGDPEGSTVLDLGARSLFAGMNPLLFRGVFTDRWETIRHHRGHRHEYDVSNTILRSDVYISVPKLKTHHKVGATLNVKGLVGINHNKNYLIHWRIGTPEIGGDEFPAGLPWQDKLLLAVRHGLIDSLGERRYAWLKQRLRTTRARLLVDDIRTGSVALHRGAWSGNDTAWRMAADLYKLFVLDQTGHRARPLRAFSLVDGIVGGEGSGPFCPTARPAGVVVAGADLLAVDVACLRLMDFDAGQIAYARHLCGETGLVPGRIAVTLRGAPARDFFDPARRHLAFVPPPHWPALSLAFPHLAHDGASFLAKETS